MQKSCPFRDVKNTQKDFFQNRVVDQKMELKENESREEVFSRSLSLCACVFLKTTHSFSGEEKRKTQRLHPQKMQTQIFSRSFFPVAFLLLFCFDLVGFFFVSSKKQLARRFVFFSLGDDTHAKTHMQFLLFCAKRWKKKSKRQQQPKTISHGSLF